MIASIQGKILDKEDGFVVVDIGGVGYKIFTTEKTRSGCAERKEIRFFTHLAVREDSMTLYGFQEKKELAIFELLLSVSGIGPKSALAILNIATVENLRSAIASGDAAHLTKTTGIGLKKAEKIVLELKDKFDFVDGELEGHKEIADAIDALVALGYTRKDAQEALKRVPVEIESVETKIKEALKSLGK